MKMIKRGWAYLAALCAAPAAWASNSSIDLGGGGSEPLEAIVSFFQDVVDFAGGPGVLLIVFLSSFAAIALWVAAPKQGGAAMAWAFRVAVGGILLFNLALLLAWLQK